MFSTLALSSAVKNRSRTSDLIVLILAVLTTNAAGAESPADRFVAGLKSDMTIPADARELIEKTWAECENCDGEEFLTQGLAVLSPRFREGLDAYDADDYQRCATIMQSLRHDSSRFVAANASAYEIKALVQSQLLQEAGERIEQLFAGDNPDLASHTYLAPEIDFLRGFCMLGNLEYRAAAEALAAFLDRHRDASRRLVIAAQQMLIELANRQPGRLGDVVDLMDYCGRRLGHSDTSETVQGRQERIITLLDRLIEEAEQSEQSGSTGSSGSSGSGSRAPSSPMQESQLPGGSSKQGPLRSARRANPGEVWGSMPSAERQRILQALRDSFPSRYRRLVEQYYEELARKP